MEVVAASILISIVVILLIAIYLYALYHLISPCTTKAIHTTKTISDQELQTFKRLCDFPLKIQTLRRRPTMLQALKYFHQSYTPQEIQDKLKIINHYIYNHLSNTQLQTYANKKIFTLSYKFYACHQDNISTEIGSFTIPYELLTEKQNNNNSQERNKLTPTLRQLIKERDNYTCKCCGKEMKDGIGLQIDHIIPINLGGKTDINNLQVLCSRCNRQKSDRIITNAELLKEINSKTKTY